MSGDFLLGWISGVVSMNVFAFWVGSRLKRRKAKQTLRDLNNAKQWSVNQDPKADAPSAGPLFPQRITFVGGPLDGDCVVHAPIPGHQLKVWALDPFGNCVGHYLYRIKPDMAHAGYEQFVEREAQA